VAHSWLVLPVSAQERGPQPVSAAALQAAIDRLGDLDYAMRMNASRTVRRTPFDQAVPALTGAVAEHADGYVRFRALVLLTGFNDPGTDAVMRRLIDDPNNRLREVAYVWFEHHPAPGMVSPLLRANEREQDDFLRPALIRALAAHGSDPRVRDTLVLGVKRGQDFFRSAVIEALGDHRAAYAVSEIIDVANLDGPLQDDAVMALGRIGDRRALETLANLQRSAPRENQPSIAAAICLLGVNCASHEEYLAGTLRFAAGSPGFQELMRGAAAAAAGLASNGSAAVLQTLFDVGSASDEPARAPLALAAATVSLRNTPLALATLEEYANQDDVLGLLADGFDMLEEDFEEEQFFATVRRRYWQAEEGSGFREVAERLIQRLEF
jgi:hypothetical protein